MIEITWLGHATIEMRLESGEVILVDPWIEHNPLYPKSHQFSRLDAILITHGHFDHLPDAVPVAKKFKPKVVGMNEVAGWLGSKGVENCIGMNKGGTVEVSGIQATMTHAVHSSGIQDGDQMIYGGEAAGFVVTLPDRRAIYFAGDTAAFSDMQLIAQLYKPALGFLPIGDHYTMGPREAALACRLLNLKQAVPIHFATFPVLTGTPAAFSAELKTLGQSTEMWPLEIGKTVKW